MTHSTEPSRSVWDMSRRGHVSGSDTAALDAIPITTQALGQRFAIVVRGSHPRAFSLDQPLVIGRDTSCDIVLPESSASRFHARLTPTADGLALKDLGSRNGTFFNGWRVESTLAIDEGILRVGETILAVKQLPDIFSPPGIEGPLVGGSSLNAIRRTLGLVAQTRMSVLIRGETGTGKEVIAHLLHQKSGRNGPMISVNCSALPETLVESELLGHVKGAFTGATRARKGLFEAADGGTLFLDEVGDLPTSAQAKLLRVLEDGKIRPVGGEREKRVNVRVISATHRRLDRSSFRADLFARLAMVELHLPPLRERIEDIPALLAYLLRRQGKPIFTIEPNALEALTLHDWPLNIRELDSVLQTAIVGSTHHIELSRLPIELQHRLSERRSYAQHTTPPLNSVPSATEFGQHELRRALIDMLEHHRGNIRQAALALGIARSTAYRVIEKWSIDVERFRQKSGTGIAERNHKKRELVEKRDRAMSKRGG